MKQPQKRYDKPGKPGKHSPWLLLVAFLGIVWVVGMVGSLIGGEPSNNDETIMVENSVPSEDYVATSTYVPTSPSPAPSSSGSGVGQVDRTLVPSERENYARDPSSQGFSESDRAFLKEHGVTETEARAIETITRQQGIE